jgi:FtsP/CotA-like multicopper oxidase with cupredoxin domain
MKNLEYLKWNRRELIKLGLMAGGASMVGSKAWTQTTSCIDQTPIPIDLAINTSCGANEKFPISPFILNPFQEELTIPPAMQKGWRRPTDGSLITDPTSPDAWQVRKSVQFGPGKVLPGPAAGQQDSMGARSRSSTDPVTGITYPLPDAGTHQLYPGQSVVANYQAPSLYHIRVQVGQHGFTKSPVQALVTSVDNSHVAGGTYTLPDSTIYGFNGTFVGCRINAMYGQPNMVRFENDLDVNPLCLDRQDFGAPDWAFLTHLHNGHTAPESDGQPHHMTDNLGGYQPTDWVDNLYLGYPAGGDDAEKQSFFWFHDHRMHHTGANVYKGMVGLYPIYDPILDFGEEDNTKITTNLHLPGRKQLHPDGTFDVNYDIPLVLYDVCLDDGVVQHQDEHMTTLGGGAACGTIHPEWWGKQYFKHFPDHGFVGDIFTVNGTAYPVFHVYQRRYRLRFLDASVSRIYQLWLMKSSAGPQAAPGTQGQWQINDGQQVMQWTQIASEGGLLPNPILRNSFEMWPAKRREFVVDFSQYMGTSTTSGGKKGGGGGSKAQATKPGDVIWLCNSLVMDTGREPNNFPADPNVPPSSVVPLMKIVIIGAPPEKDLSDPSLSPNGINRNLRLRPMPTAPTSAQVAAAPTRVFTLQRGSSPSPETQWLINGLEFNPLAPLALPVQGSAEVWHINNGGGGWVHPMHLHMEEHRILNRNGVPAPDALHPDDTGKEDVIALYPSEQTTLWRKFRTFKGKYVAHCHNLAHEDHNMMFGWTIR